MREDTLRNISLSHPPLHLLTRGAIDSWELCRIESIRPRLSSTRPENRVAVSDDVAETLRDLIDWLEGLDDVQEVYHNAALAGQS